jgi:hypothetical protein
MNDMVDEYNNVTPIRYYSEPSLSLEQDHVSSYKQVSPPYSNVQEEYVPNSPPYSNVQEEYVPNSPPYSNVQEEYVPNSPPYSNMQEEYVPNSPPYSMAPPSDAPQSPPYSMAPPSDAPQDQVPLQRHDKVRLKGDPHVWEIYGLDNTMAMLRRRDELNNRITMDVNKSDLTKVLVQGGSVNDIVTFRGDYDKNRKWMIESIEKGFAVLKTNDTAGLTGGSNTKVVALSDIDPYVPPDTLTTLNAPTQAVQSQPPIVLNIVNGDGNKVQQTSEPNNHKEETTKDDSVKEENIFDKPMIKKPPVENSSNVFSQGPLVVKKV